MKLLFDENLSFRLVPALADIYPHSTHVRHFHDDPQATFLPLPAAP